MGFSWDFLSLSARIDPLLEFQVYLRVINDYTQWNFHRVQTANLHHDNAILNRTVSRNENHVVETNYISKW